MGEGGLTGIYDENGGILYVQNEIDKKNEGRVA